MPVRPNEEKAKESEGLSQKGETEERAERVMDIGEQGSVEEKESEGEEMQEEEEEREEEEKGEGRASIGGNAPRTPTRLERERSTPGRIARTVAGASIASSREPGTPPTESAARKSRWKK